VSQLDREVLLSRNESFALGPLIQRAVEEVQGSYAGQRMDLVGPADLRVLADPDRILQVLVNLLDNAAKYARAGSPTTVYWSVEGGLAIVRVRDQGPGVPEQGREHLFTRFGRVPGSRMRAGRVGTGLGLYLSRRLAETMGGTLDLEATGPEGSTFRLRIPVAPR
jgi:signal transduction histidine kinase